MTGESSQTLDVSKHVWRGRRLARHVWTHFQEDRCLAEAASLSYTSLLSLVPLLAVVFGIVAAFPVFEEWAERLQSVILENFMPAAGNQIVPYLNSFLESVSKLTLVGIVNADQGLFGTDFRSAERMAQSIVQVAGRAGRAERAGEVLIQTAFPENPFWETLMEKGYRGVARERLQQWGVKVWSDVRLVNTAGSVFTDDLI